VPRVRVSYLCWRSAEQVEPVVELHADNGVSFRAGELLFKLHQAVAADLQHTDHRFLEGLRMYSPPPPDESPFYYLKLGS
jgi:hypothetical protein